MKKLLIAAGALVVVLVVGFLVFSFFLGSIVTKGVNRFGPGITQTKFVLQDANLSAFSGSGTLNGLVIGNPAGWSANNLCSLGKIHVRMEPTSVLRDHIVVHTIEIESPEFNYETKLVSSNVADLLKNIEQAVGGGKPETQPQKDGKPIKLEVKRFRLVNGKVRLGVGTAAMVLPMPDIELTDIGTKEGGVTPGQLAFAVMRAVTTNIVNAAAKAITSGGATSTQAIEGAKQIGEAIKGIFGGKK